MQIFVTGYAVPDEEDQGATGEPRLERTNGSGVILDADGYIVTNAHVVQNATRIEVELPFEATGGAPGRSILKHRGRIVGAQIVAIDPETDLAVVKVEARGLPALPFGDSDTLRSGQMVLAFGSPLGLDSSVSMGVVSAVARQLAPEDPMIYIQTDTTINPGNSGGALVNTEGPWSASTRSSSPSRGAAKESASPRRATSSATSSTRSARPAGSGAGKSASTRRPSRP